MLRRLAVIVSAALGSAVAFSGCALAPSDPPAPPVALRVDEGVMRVTVGSCMGDVLAVAITPVMPDGELAATASFEADISGGGFSLGLDEPGVISRGTYSTKDPLIVEVETEKVIAVGEWPGTSASTAPAELELVMVDDQVMGTDAFESLACP